MSHSAGDRSTPDPDLELVEQVIVDGDNLLHGVRGSRDAGGIAWLLPRLSAWRPPGVEVIITLDGHADRGLGDRRPIAPGVSVRHAGSRSADDVIVWILEARPWAERARTIVVTDDGRLRERVGHAGGIGRRVSWLVARLSGSGGPTGDGRPAAIGQGKPPSRSATPGEDGPDDVTTWKPGRGATRKRGNPRRAPRRAQRG